METARSRSKNRIRRLAIWIAAAVLANGLFAVPVSANGPGQYSKLDDVVYARLMDDTADWDEIELLVKYFNPTYRSYADSVDATNNDLSAAGDSFTDEINASIETIDENLETVKKQREGLSKLPGSMVIDTRGTTVDQAMAQLDSTEAQLKAGRTKAKQGLGQALTSITKTRITTEESMRQVREQIAKVVESLYISYAQLKINRELVVKQIALYETALETNRNMQKNDLATEADVASAEASLEEAKINLRTVDNGIAQLQTAIGLQLGWSAEDPPVIGEVPAPDIAFIESVDKDADYVKALENNKTYQETKKLSNYTGSSAIVKRDAAVNEANGNASAKFEALYSEMLRQKFLYEAAQTSLKRSKITRDSAEEKMKLGLTGRAEYEGAQLEYLSYEASAALAALSLTAAILDYQWAVKGYMDY